MKGKEFFRNGEIHFPDQLENRPDHLGLDGTYRTYFGPSISTNGLIYGKSNHNTRLATRRLSCARGNLELDTLYLKSQNHFISHSHPFLKLIKDHISGTEHDFSTLVQAAEDHHDDPHPKRKLRQQAWVELGIGDYKGLNVADRLWLRNVKYKMKTDEVAKILKYPRMIGDLGVAASLQGFWITHLMKDGLAREPLVYKDGEMEFCAKPNPTDLERIFEKLRNPPGRYYFVYFSDDSCLSFRDDDGGVHMYNVDISKCDASHGPFLFKALEEITPDIMKDGMAKLVDQCMLPIKISNVNDPRQSVTLQPTRPRLYSGSTITTLINNLANLLICLAFVDQGRFNSDQDVISAAAKAGYIVTCETVDPNYPEDIQFLKHSPVRDSTGRWRAMLNLGVLLRSSGSCKGDLPGSKKESLESRARKFQGALLKGMYPRVEFQLLDNLTQQTLTPEEKQIDKVSHQLYHKVVDQGDTFRVLDSSLYRRYRLTPSQIDTLNEGFGRGEFEESFASDALETILEKDYGLKCQYV